MFLRYVGSKVILIGRIGIPRGEVCVCVWGGGGYSDIIIHTYVRAIFGGSTFLFSIFEGVGGGGVQKNKYFWGYEDFVDFLGVITKMTSFRGQFYVFRVFS